MIQDDESSPPPPPTKMIQVVVEEEKDEDDDDEEEEDDDDEEEEPEGMALSPMASNHNNHHQQQQQTEGMMTTFSSSPVHDFDTIMCEESPPPTLMWKSSSVRKRKKPWRKDQRKPLKNRKRRAALEMKLQCCRENLQPIPFVPTKTLDFSKHEQLFKRLGLWDFVHIEFDRVIRSDLLSQLIVSYKERSSTVNDLKIKVNRADLGRALKLPLPVKKKTMDLDAAEVLSEESISFLDEFVSNWFLLHDDMWMMMPDEEVLNNTRCIKEGQPEKVDWPGLIWYMVEKELSQGTKLKSCYYASHLQYLMRSQKDVLFTEEEPKLEEESMELKEENADAKRIRLLEEEELGKQHIELALGEEEKNNVEQQDRDDEDVMDFQECKEPGGHWFMDGKNIFDSFKDHCEEKYVLSEELTSHEYIQYCVDQIKSWADKVRVSHVQMNEKSINAQMMNQEYLMSEIQRRDDVIATLHKTKYEEIQRREKEMKKFEDSCLATLEASKEKVINLLDKRLLELEEVFSAKQKMPEAHKIPEEEGCIVGAEEKV